MVKIGELINICHFTDEYITFAIFIAIGVRGLYASFVPSYAASKSIPVYAGSYYHMMGAHPFHAEFLFIFWSSGFLANSCTSTFFQVKHFKWIEMIRVFEGKTSAKKIGL